MFRVRVPSARHLAAAVMILGLLACAGCSSPEERAQRHYESGMELLKKQDYAHAGIEFKNALQLNGEMVPAWLGLAQVDEHDQKWDELRKILRKVTELDKANLDARVRLARLMLLGRNFEQALIVTNEAEKIDPKNAGVHALKAVTLFKLGETGSAVTEAQTALELDPLNSEAIVVLAAYRLAHDDADGALLMLDRDPDKHAKDLGIQIFKLKLLETKGDVSKIEPFLNQLIENFPEEPGFRKLLVQFYLQQNRKDDAEKTIRAIADANPSNSDAKLELARFLFVIKGPDAARQELVALIAAGGDVFPYQIALAELDYTQGRASDSIALLDELSKSKESDEHKRTAKIKLAEQQIGQKNYEAAEVVVSDILAKDERDVNGLRLRAMLRLANGQVEPAITDLREAINQQPDSPDLQRLLAIAYERNGSIELADEAFGKVTKVSNFAPAIGLEYAAFLQRHGKADRAEDLLTEISTHSPKDARVLAALAQVKLARQDWVGAQQVAESMRRADDTSGVANQILGEALAGQKKYDLSIDVLQDAYNASPDAAQPMASLVRAFLRAKQPDKAEDFIQSVLKANPSSAEAYILLGSIQLQNGEDKKALESFNTAIAKQPDQPAGYIALGEYYAREKHYAEAVKALQAGLEKQPKNFALRLQLAGLEELQGNHDAAITQYDALLAEQPGSFVIMNNLASLLADYRSDQASLDRANSLAVSLTKMDVPQFKDTLGWIQYRKGDFKSAIELLEAAQQALPNLALVRYHLGMSYLAAGEKAKATEQLKKALELLPTSGGVAEGDIKSGLEKAGAT